MELPEIKIMPITHEQFLKWQVIEYNKVERPDKIGYSCSACKNRRYYAVINSEGDFALRPCNCNTLITRQLEEKQAKKGKKNV